MYALVICFQEEIRHVSALRNLGFEVWEGFGTPVLEMGLIDLVLGMWE